MFSVQASDEKDAFIREALALGKYKVLDDGAIVSCVRRRPRIIKQSEMDDGYCRVGLSIDGEVHYVKAHRVVAIARVPNPDAKPCVNHKDGVKSNNHPSNLEWATNSENVKHADLTGLRCMPCGAKNHQSKLTNDNVREILRLRATTKLSQREIGEMFGVKQSTVSDIERGKNWIKLEDTRRGGK
jgi:hypothetical protein